MILIESCQFLNDPVLSKTP